VIPIVYGNTAKLNEAWPKVLARLTGKNVYNLAMGGYSPNQYYYLLQTKAFGLKLATIICCLYIGEDFDNAYRIILRPELLALLEVRRGVKRGLAECASQGHGRSEERRLNQFK
jgi:hypothetical protein